MRKQLRVFLVLVCVLALTLAASSSAVAARGSDSPASSAKAPSGKAYGHFKDVGDRHWAYRDITVMEAKGVFAGYGDGKFGPQDTVTSVQLVLLAVRVTGQLDEAGAMPLDEVAAILDGDWLDPSDPLPTWAGVRECLAYAYREGYLEAFLVDGGKFAPNRPATRLEVVVTLLKAMGLAGAAAELTEAPIEAPDADTVPEWAHGYVALAIKMEMLRGDETGALNLDDTVTRAQMAALLCRCDEDFDSDVDRRMVVGRVVAVTTGDQPTITIETRAVVLEEYEPLEADTEEGEQPAEGDEEEPVEGEEPAEGDEEEPVEGEEPAEGDEEEPVEGEEPAEGDEQEPVEGEEPEEGEDEEPAEGDECEPVIVTYAVDPGAKVFVDGKPATLGDVKPGFWVRLALVDGLVVLIDGRSSSDGSDEGTQVSGPVAEVVYDGDVLKSLTVVVVSLGKDFRLEKGFGDGWNVRFEGFPGAAGGSGKKRPVGEKVTFSVAPDVSISGSKDGKVRVGDYVVLTLDPEGVVVAITVKQKPGRGTPPPSSGIGPFKGSIRGTFVSTDGTSITLEVTPPGRGHKYGHYKHGLKWSVSGAITLPLAEKVTVTDDDERITLDDLIPGTPIKVKLTDGVVTSVHVLDSTEEEQGEDESEEDQGSGDQGSGQGA
ncbi:MAG: S-layer homology domain-containing protein [Firmicutes bacterium]|nr:S-layer homology domain-containing protein [Bacillota bacterium]